MMKNKTLNSFFLLFLIGLTLYGLFYSDNLQQKNRETIFLTNIGIQDYLKFKENFHEKSFVVVKKEFATEITADQIIEFRAQVEKLRTNCEDESCELITAENFPNSFHSLFELKGNKYLSLILVGESGNVKIQNLMENITTNPYWGKIGQDLHLVGVPFTNKLLNQYSKSIKDILFPSLFVAVFIFLVLFLKSFKSGFLLFFPCLSAASFSLAYIKFFLGESNLITAIVPLLMFVINLSLVLHLYYTAIELGGLAYALKNKLKPITLMILTTFTGFLSLYISNLKAISTFGLMSALLIFATSLFSILWMHVASCAVEVVPLNKGIPKKISLNFSSWFGQSFSFKIIIYLSLFSFVAGSICFMKIPIITDATRYFPKITGLKESIDHVAQTVMGPAIMDIVLDIDDQLNLKTLFELENLEHDLNIFLKKQNLNLKLLSLNTLIKKTNLSYLGEEKLPEQMISYLTLRGRIPEIIREGFPLNQKYRLTIFGPPMNVEQYGPLTQKIKEILNKYSYTNQFNGLYFHLMTAQEMMISTLFKSFLLSLVTISLLAFLAFKKIKVFFIFLLVNIVPVFLSFIPIYFFGLSFNIATVMTYSISLGLIVDSSFHIIHVMETPQLNFDYFYKTVILPVLGSSLLLASCFVMFALNDFLPIREFGLCLAIIIIFGMIFDLKVLPTLFLGSSNLSQNGK